MALIHFLFQYGQVDAAEAAEFPANICMRSGRRASPGQLVKEWTGLWVLPEHLDHRHPQDLIRPRHADRQRVPDPRPETADRFLTANEVTRESL